MTLQLRMAACESIEMSPVVLSSDANMAQGALEISKNLLENSKKVLEFLVPPRAGEKRDGWFYRAARDLDIPARRLKSLYYDPRCKMWADELESIQRRQGLILKQRLDDLRLQQEALRARLIALGERYHDAEAIEAKGGAGAAQDFFHDRGLRGVGSMAR